LSAGDSSRHSAAYSDDGGGASGGNAIDIIDTDNKAAAGGSSGGGRSICGTSSDGNSSKIRRRKEAEKARAEQQQHLGLPVDLPSAALGLKWSRTTSFGTNSSDDSDDNCNNNDRSTDPNYYDPTAINALNSAQSALDEKDFVPTAPLCRSVDEAMFALHELLNEVGRSPYDADPYVLSPSGAAGEGGDHGAVEYDWLLDGDDLAYGYDSIDKGNALYNGGEEDGGLNEECAKMLDILYGNGVSSGIDESIILVGVGRDLSPCADENSEEVEDVIVPFASFDADATRQQVDLNRDSAGTDGDVGGNDEVVDGAVWTASTGNTAADDLQRVEETGADDQDDGLLETDMNPVLAGDTPHTDAADDLSSSSSSSESDGSLLSASEEEEDDPPILLDLAIGRSADFLRSLPLAEPTSEEARFIRRTQLRLIRQAERGSEGGEYEEGLYSEDESYSSLDDATASDNSSLCTDEGEEEEHGQPSEPYNDEDNWWRRSASEIERSLPAEFFSDTADPLLATLLSVPWDERPPSDPAYVHGARASFDKMEPYDEYFSRKLSELDQAQRRVTKRLVARIQERTPGLQRGMKRIQDLDLDIARAHLDAEAGATCLKRARGAADEADELGSAGGVLGGLRIVRDADARDRLKSLRSVVEEVDGLIRTEAGLMAMPVSVTEYQGRIQTAVQLRESMSRLEGGQLSRLKCLQPLRQRVANINVHLVSQMKASFSSTIAERCERTSLSTDVTSEANVETTGFLLTEPYATLLHARLLLAKQEGQVNVETILSDWTHYLVDTFCLEADVCVARALLDPTETARDCEDIEGSEHAQDLLHLRYQCSQLQRTSPDVRSTLRIVLHNLYTIRFDFENDKNLLPWIYHKLCVLVTEVMRVYYGLEQWHAAPSEDQSSGESSVQSPPSQGMTCSDIQRRIEEEGDSQQWDIASISARLHDCRLTLWQHCQSIFIKFLDRYIVHTAKKKALQSNGGDESGGDGKWAVQLEGLHDMWQLTKQMVMLGNEFVGNVDSEIDEEWQEKLSQIFRSHLRGVHIEAMNTMGALLAHETWMLLPTQIDSHGGWTNHREASADNLKPGCEVKDALKRVLDSHCPLHFVDSRVLASSGRRTWDNSLQHQDSNHFEELDNPFLSPCESPKDPQTEVLSNRPVASLSSQPVTVSLAPSEVKQDNRGGDLVTSLEDALYASIYPFIVQDPAGQRVLSIATQGTLNGLAKWTARLFKIMNKLPVIVEDAAKVISNLFDMYLLTVLRMCAGNEANETVLLGMTSGSVIPKVSESGGDSAHGNLGHARSSSHDSVGSPISLKRTPSASLTSSPISDTVDADICAPLPDEISGMAALQQFVSRGHESLDGMVNLRRVEKWEAISQSHVKATSDPNMRIRDAAGILERQISAASSCLFAGALLDVALLQLQASMASENIGAFASYASSVVEIVPALSSLASRISCVRAIKGKRTVLEVMMVGSAWKDSRFREHCNDYVHEMCLRCARLWDYLSSSPHKLPSYALAQTWHLMVEGSFLSLLEGFSKIVVCSMEGRALMSMDLATFYAGIYPSAIVDKIQDVLRSSPDPPPAISSSNRGMQYVDTYVKAFYFPEEDMIHWIESTHMSYHLRHMVGLISCAALGNGWRARKVENLIQQVEAFYETG